jgi:hypothetical protein
MMRLNERSCECECSCLGRGRSVERAEWNEVTVVRMSRDGDEQATHATHPSYAHACVLTFRAQLVELFRMCRRVRATNVAPVQRIWLESRIHAVSDPPPASLEPSGERHATQRSARNGAIGRRRCMHVRLQSLGHKYMNNVDRWTQKSRKMQMLQDAMRCDAREWTSGVGGEEVR